MGSNNSMTRIREILLSAPGPIYIFSHPFPDGDSVGSTLGLYYLLRAAGIQSYPVLPVPAVYNFLLTDVEVLSPPVDIQGKTVVVLDCSDLKRLEQTGQTLKGAAQIINIDHHLNNDMFGEINYVDSNAAAVGQIIHDMFSDSSPFPQEAAQALFTAIYTDTGRFSYSNTRSGTLKTAATLVELGANPPAVYNHIFQNRSLGYFSLLAEVLGEIVLFCNNQAARVNLSRQLLSKYSLEDWELDDLNDYPRSLRGVIVSVIFKEVENNIIKVSFRSKGKLNVAEIARYFGGGGHKNASGVTMNMTLTEANEQIQKRLEQELGL